METKELVLPVGFKYDNEEVKTLQMAITAGAAEDVYTKKVGRTKLYTWFAEVIAVSTDRIGGKVGVSEVFLKDKHSNIPSVIKKIPLLDAGTLLLQIHTEAWQDLIRNQDHICMSCGHKFKTTVDLAKIPIPEKLDSVPTEIVVDLGHTYKLNIQQDRFKEFSNVTFNTAIFRIPTLEDAIRREGIATKEVEFWRNIAFDCLTGLCQKDADGEIVDEVPPEYITARGSLLYKTDLGSKSLRTIRDRLQNELPSAKMYYEDECPSCKAMTPHIAPVENFFSV